MPEVQKRKANNSLENFIRENSEQGEPESRFELVSQRVLRIDVDGRVWLNLGAAIAFYGNLKFNRLPTLKAKKLTKMALREIAPLVFAEGKGRLYCAHIGWHIRTIRLSGETLNISTTELLAFEDSLDFEMSMIGSGVSLTSGGVVAAKLSGEGWFAIAVHGDPLVLPVTPDEPLNTDPHATVAWTEGLKPELRADLTWRSLIKHGGGEPFQIYFAGSGHVVVQPSEDPMKFTGKKLKSLL